MSRYIVWVLIFVAGVIVGTVIKGKCDKNGNAESKPVTARDRCISAGGTWTAGDGCVMPTVARPAVPPAGR